jgi:3-deoxy-D-manno-octulosonic-acid transferase
MVLLNARLSKRSARGYARVAALTRPTLAYLSGIAAQGRADARRLRALGVNPDVLAVTGNLKFAIDTDALHRANERERSALGPGLAGRPVWLAASTHAGEEECVLKAFSELKKERPDAFLMLAPRHSDRVASVLALPELDQYRVVLHSAFNTAPTSSEKAAQRAVGKALCDKDDVLIVDTLGHLGALTGCADLVFVGGSLVPHGGHNPLEAAAWRLPILTGGHVFNFSAIYRDLVNLGAAMEVETSTLPAVLLDCLGEHADAARMRAMGARASEYQSAQGDVLGRQWAVLNAHLP